MSSIVFAAFAGKGAREKAAGTGRGDRPDQLDLMAAVRNGDTEEVHGCLSTSANETSAEEARRSSSRRRASATRRCAARSSSSSSSSRRASLPEDSLNEALLAAVTYDEAAAAAPPPPLPTVPRPSLPGGERARGAAAAGGLRALRDAAPRAPLTPTRGRRAARS